MNFVEAWRDATESLAAHKLRASLSMLGMIFGVGAVIAMLSIGAGAERQALALIERLGLSNVLVEARDLNREDLMEIREQSPGLSSRDVLAIEESVPGVVEVASRVRVEPYQIRSDLGKAEARVFGVSPSYFGLSDLRAARGRLLDERDEESFAQVCVIGPGVERVLFGYEPGLGRLLKINDVWLEVKGVLAEHASAGSSLEGVRATSASDEIYLPHTTALRKFDLPPLDSPLDRIVVHTEEGASPWETAAAVKSLLDVLHGGVEDFDIIVPEALLEQSRETRRLFNIVMGAIAGISLLVGGIGIMNIMLASVLERTREIGIRRAVGARRSDIRIQFLVESFSISFLGGLAGILMGLAIAHAIAAYADWPTVVTLWSILLSTIVSVSVGVISGLYPAQRAAELDPVLALGYE